MSNVTITRRGALVGAAVAPLAATTSISTAMADGHGELLTLLGFAQVSGQLEQFNGLLKGGIYFQNG